MRNIIILLLLAAQAQAQTVHTYTAAANNGEIYKNSLPSVLPGDTIKLVGVAGKADIVYLNGIAGTAEAPIIITVDDTLQVGVTRTNYAIWLNGSHFKLLGKNMLTIKPSEGDTLSTGLSLNGSSDYTVLDMQIHRCRAAIIQNPTQGGLRGNIVIRGIKFYDLRTSRTGTCEAIYIGSTELRQLGPHTILRNNVVTAVNAWFNNILIEDCYGYGLDGDFIQVAMSQNVTIRNCHVWNWGRLNLNAHKNAFVFGGSSTISLLNSSATNGSGPYVQVFGINQNLISNCTFNGGATGSSSDDGIYINKTNADTNALYLTVENTVVNGARRNAIRNEEALRVSLCNVTMASTAARNSGANFVTVTTCTETPPPPHPVQPVKPGSKPNKVRGGRVIRLRG